VRLEAEALAAWEEHSGRDLASNERYAVAKMALFQAFDERPTPELMLGSEIRVRFADVAAILGMLGIE
jgi:hypothetical protein